MYVFRDGADYENNTVRLRGLDAEAAYKVHSFNERTGKETYKTSAELMNEGIHMRLPHPELNGCFNPKIMDEFTHKEFLKQLANGSDLLLLTRME